MPNLQSRYRHVAPSSGPMGTADPLVTHEGDVGFSKDVKTELFTLAVARFNGEDSFYETAKQGSDRFATLVREAAALDAPWTAGLIRWLRIKAHMRTGSVVAAMEYASVVEGARSTVAAALQRADEPGEAIAYWFATHGRRMPAAVKRGIADAATRLYSAKSYVKWDSRSDAYRFADVIELTHPIPRNSAQSALFRRILEDRHGRERDLTPVPGVDGYRNWIKAGAPLGQMPEAATWENVSAHHKMDADSWKAIIPQMGHMALLRNLRNFEDAGVDDATLGRVADKLADPHEVALSKQLPFRFYTAYVHSGTTRFAPALEKALDLSLSNVPSLKGSTLVMVDCSGSMTRGLLSAKSQTAPIVLAALFGTAVAFRSERFGMAMYDNQIYPVQPMRSLLRTVEDMQRRARGGSTHTWPLTKRVWEASGPYDRVVVLTDMQDHPGPGAAFVGIPAHVPVYVWDCAGYQAANLELGSGRYMLSGMSDKAFKLMEILESGTDAGWPWEVG